jgi:hypothetical protein
VVLDDPRGPDKTGKVKDITKAGRVLKQAFAKNADRAFLDSLVTVHWTLGSDLINLLLGKVSSRDELSASAYMPGKVRSRGLLGDFGMIIKGYITLLANDMDQLYTGKGEDYTSADPERTKMSGANKGIQQKYSPTEYSKHEIIVLDRRDWFPKKNYRGRYNNEALVDNWSPLALIVPEDLIGQAGGPPLDYVEKFEKLVQKAGLDIPVMSAAEFGKGQQV